MKRYFLGITGASGHAYARRLLTALVELGHEVDVCLTPAAHLVLRHELGDDPGPGGERLGEVLAGWAGAGAERVRVFRPEEVDARASSGTSGTAAVVLCPCSMGTLARVSVGFSSNLVERAADVALKEGRRLLLVPRETPLSPLHLESMLRLARLGAVVLPAMPGFYHRPRSLEDLVDHVVGKVLDRLGVEHSVGARWKGPPEPDDEPGIGGPLPPDPLSSRGGGEP